MTEPAEAERRPLLDAQQGCAAEEQTDRGRARAGYSLALLLKRRRYLIDRRQWRNVLAVTGTVALLLVLLNLSLYTSRRWRGEAALVQSPELAAAVHHQDRVELVLVLLGSAVLVAGVFIVVLLETHKTYGPLVGIVRHLRRLQQGDYGTRLTLRRDDNLQPAADAINDLARALEDRRWRDVRALEELASRAERIETDEARDLAQQLNALARR